MPPERLRKAFAGRYGYPCRVLASAPGRVNLIGEHTDYNDGFVLPVATGERTWVALGRRPGADNTCRVHSEQVGQSWRWTPGAVEVSRLPPWTRYVVGTAELLRAGGVALEGADLLIHSEVPPGGGLSSSAALTVSVALGLAALGGVSLPRREIAALCRQAEHEYAGVPCGFMDQYAVLFAQAGHALLLDCRSLEFEHVPLPAADHVFVAVDSGVRHELAAGEYAQRRAQCAEAVAVFARHDPRIRALRDVDQAVWRAHADELPPLVAARARHVLTENRRTLSAVEAMRAGDWEELGRLMSASHDSLRDDFQVSCRELDQLVEIASNVPGVRGARMTGGGFGGNVVVLVRREAVPTLRERIAAEYNPQSARDGFRVIEPGAGAAVESC